VLFKSLNHRHPQQLLHTLAFIGGLLHAGWTAQCCAPQLTDFSAVKHSSSCQPALSYPKVAAFCTTPCVLT